MVRSLMRAWLTASREQYSCVGGCQRSFECCSPARRSMIEVVESRSPTSSTSARSDWLAAAKNALNASPRRARRGRRAGSGEVEVVVGEVHREREHAQAVVVGRALAGRELTRVVAQRAEERREAESLARRAATTACASRRAACIHGGVESRPHSHGWMSVMSGESSSRRSRNSQRWYASTFGASSATNAARSSSRERGGDPLDRDRSEGGCVMQLVATSRGAPGRVRDRQTRRLPTSRDAVGEDHVREHPVVPLTSEQRPQLVGGAARS